MKYLFIDINLVYINLVYIIHKINKYYAM